jgi:hypothetical protein
MVSETFVHQTHPKAESEALCRPASMATNDCNVSGNTEGMLVVPEIKFIKLFINSSLMPSLVYIYALPFLIALHCFLSNLS